MEPSMTWFDGDKVLRSFSRPPNRVVSLVPSITESIFSLGAGDNLVGATNYCDLPSGSDIQLVGGPKTADAEVILALQPDLIMANQEENERGLIEALCDAGLTVWLSFPRSVDDVLEFLWQVVKVFRMMETGRARMKSLETIVEWRTRAMHQRPPVRVFCPIWQDQHPEVGVWWMTFNRETYAHDLLLRCGGMNVFADRERRYPLGADLEIEEAADPGERDMRYPRIRPAEVESCQPEVILLPSEPYVFGESEKSGVCDMLANTPAVQQGRVHFVEGSLITWHGTRMARALSEIPELL
jgi:ABC-type hemin transport system substrate-binding protein